MILNILTYPQVVEIKSLNFSQHITEIRLYSNNFLLDTEITANQSGYTEWDLETSDIFDKKEQIYKKYMDSAKCDCIKIPVVFKTKYIENKNLEDQSLYDLIINKFQYTGPKNEIKKELRIKIVYIKNLNDKFNSSVNKFKIECSNNNN
jgi:hypothetical protein